ncbi:MAG: hypothetical protein ACR2QM_15235 [Longimicrobiales bacterium]
MSVRRNARSLKAQIDAVVDADWSHPAWWLLAWLTGLLERFGSPHRPEDQVRHHGANGGPDSDTFMARPREEVGDTEHGSLAEWGARKACAGLSALGELETHLPDQPLRVALRWDRGWLEVFPLPLEARANVVFTIRGSHFLAGGQSMNQERLAEGLKTLLQGRPPPDGFRTLPDEDVVPASLVVSLDVHHHETARHAHRMTWNALGGPWLGIVRTPELDLVTTCHLVVDGLGHALLTDHILDRPSGGATRQGIRSLSPGPVGSANPSTGLAWAYLPTGVGKFAEQAFATGVTLESFFGASGHARHANGRRRYSPPFTVPVAPGSSADPGRRLKRVVHGLLSVRREAAAETGAPNGFERFAAFKQRIGPWLKTERSGGGVLARISSAVSRGPLPRPLKHLALTNHHGPNGSIPSVEGLSGRARLSSIRFPESGVRAPLIAASLPTLLPNKDDERGGVVLTLIHHDEGATVTVFGTGRAAKEGGAQAFLERWLNALEDVRKG